VESAVQRVLESGARTADIAHGGASVNCAQMTDLVLAELG